MRILTTATWSALALSLLPSLSCVMPPKRYSGGAVAPAASVAMETGRVWVRPHEFAWVVGERVDFDDTVDAAELGNFVSHGAVMVDADASGSATLPNHVELAATRELIKRGVDGLLVTHYLVDTVTDATGTVHRVTARGRLLHLQDIGEMDPDRADLRRLLQNIEGGASASPVRSAPQLSAPVAAPLPRVSSTSDDGLRIGVEFGSPTGLTIDVPVPGEVLDAIGVRVGAQLGLLYGYYPVPVAPQFTVQAEFLRNALVQPVVGVGFGVMVYSGVYPAPGAVLGAEIDPPGPFELNIGAQLASASGLLFSPTLSAGWLW